MPCATWSAAVLWCDAIGIVQQSLSVTRISDLADQNTDVIRGAPALSRLQLKPACYKQYHLTATLAMTLLGMPLVVLMFVRAEEIIRVVICVPSLIYAFELSPMRIGDVLGIAYKIHPQKAPTMSDAIERLNKLRKSCSFR